MKCMKIVVHQFTGAIRYFAFNSSQVFKTLISSLNWDKLLSPLKVKKNISLQINMQRKTTWKLYVDGISVNHSKVVASKTWLQ